MILNTELLYNWLRSIYLLSLYQHLLVYLKGSTGLIKAVFYGDDAWKDTFVNLPSIVFLVEGFFGNRCYFEWPEFLYESQTEFTRIKKICQYLC